MKWHGASVVLLLLITATSALFVLTEQVVQAGDLSNRSLVLGTSKPSETTSYDLNFQFVSTDPVGSIIFEFCGNSPLPEDPCISPSGFDASATYTSTQTGEAGFLVTPTSSYEVLFSRTPSTVPVPPGVTNFVFEDIVNPDTSNTVYYLRISTFSSSDGTGTPVDQSSLALSTAEQLSLSTYVPPYLEFCVGVSIIGNDCGSIVSNQVDLGSIKDTTTSATTTQFRGATNAANGYNVFVRGETLRSGINSIPALLTPQASSVGSGQFGINLRANTAPFVGAEPSGPGAVVPIGDYNVPNQYVFRSNDLIARTTLPDFPSTVTVSYIVNIPEGQAVGKYSTTLTYICTGNF